jgi:beta-lactamase regulating signal transducer with metallopeptidase domain
VIVGGDDVLLAAAGLTHPTVVVSAGALTALDDAELAAGLEHERGHIARHHRYLLLFAEGCRALGALLPGTRRAAAELAYHLERDADAYALARSHEPLALASAICKAAGARPTAALMMGLGGGVRLQERVQGLIDIRPSSVDVRWDRIAVVTTTLLFALVVLLAVAVPALALGATGHTALPVHSCPS